METAVQTLFLGLSLNPKPKLINQKQTLYYFITNLNLSCKIASFSQQTKHRNRVYWTREKHRCVPPRCAALSEDVGVSSSQFEDFLVMTTSTNEAEKLKIRVEVSGARTRAIFDNVFDKMVAAAQPIPGFRRVKGGKTPDIPRDILLEVLGPSKVYKEVIKKVINSTVAEYVEKEGLKVGKDLRVEQSIEELEDVFEPDEKFSFNAIIQLQEVN